MVRRSKRKKHMLKSRCLCILAGIAGSHFVLASQVVAMPWSKQKSMSGHDAPIVSGGQPKQRTDVVQCMALTLRSISAIFAVGWQSGSVVRATFVNHATMEAWTPFSLVQGFIAVRWAFHTHPIASMAQPSSLVALHAVAAKT